MSEGEKNLELILSRQSDRSYSEKKVEQEKLGRILEAGRMSPSACNAQPWKFIAVTSPELVKELAGAASAKLLGMNSFVGQAPVIIVIIREQANFSSRAGAVVKKKDYSLIDIGIATGSMCLQATAEGLGSCIIGWFDEKEVRKILGIPSSKRVELMITIGYPLAQRRDKKRKPVEDTVSFNHY